MEGVLYYGKVNIVSKELIQAYNKEVQFNILLANIFSALKDGSNYTKKRQIKTKNGFKDEETVYSLSVKKREEDSIWGYIYKKSFIHYKSYDNAKQELKPEKVESIEGIEFWYDVYRETVAYKRSIRFGYREFLKAFEGIINNACKLANLNYVCSVNLYVTGLDINNIKDELHDEDIEKLNIIYQIPNPDPDILKAIQIDPEKTISQFEDANVLTKNISYQALPGNKINIDSELIEQEINNITKLHSHIDTKKAISNGYIIVETTSTSGIFRSSRKRKPIVQHYSSDDENFYEIAPKGIKSVVLKSYFNSNI